MDISSSNRSSRSAGLLVNFSNWLRKLFWGHRLTQEREILARAEHWAAKKSFNLAMQLTNELLRDWDAAPRDWNRRWRRWQSKPVSDQLAILLPQWQQAIENYQATLALGRQAAANGNFLQAKSQAQKAYNYCRHDEAPKFLAEVEQAIQYQDWFALGLAAEAAGNWELSCYHYHNIIAQVPAAALVRLCEERLLLVALRSHDWETVILLTENSPEHIAQRRAGLAKLLQKQISKLELLRQIQANLHPQTIEKAWVDTIAYLDQFEHDDSIQQILGEFIQPQLLTMPENWHSRFQLAQMHWQQAISPEIFHDWAIAAYYRVLGAPERLDWLKELIPIWVTALLNFHLDPTLEQLPWFDGSLTLGTDVRGQLYKMVQSLVDRVDDVEQRQELMSIWSRELSTVELLGNPPTKGIRIQGVYLSPGFYEMFQAKIKNIKLPAQPWAMFYTPWWQAVIACQNGQVIKAMQLKSQLQPSSPADFYAQRFVAYYEGCYYLECKNTNFARWREAIKPLELAKPLILENEDWWNQVDRLCDRHHQLIWQSDDLMAFGEFWYNLLESDDAGVFLDSVTAEAMESNYGF